MIFVVGIYMILLAVGVVFQLALALGAPLGEYTMGGAFSGKLPPKMRVAALAQIVILFVIGLIVLAASGLAFPRFAGIANVAIWFVAVFFVLGSILNLSTKSAKERNLWAPVNIVLLILSIIVAVS
jgi:hypothetical protein